MWNILTWIDNGYYLHDSRKKNNYICKKEKMFMSVYYCFSNFYQYYEKIKYQKFMKLVKKTKNKLKIKLCIEGGQVLFSKWKELYEENLHSFCGKYYLLNCNWQKRMFPVSEMLTKHSWHWSKMEGLTTPQASFSFTRTSLLSNHLWEAVKAKTLNRILIRITR